MNTYYLHQYKRNAEAKLSLGSSAKLKEFIVYRICGDISVLQLFDQLDFAYKENVSI